MRANVVHVAASARLKRARAFALHREVTVKTRAKRKVGSDVETPTMAAGTHDKAVIFVLFRHRTKVADPAPLSPPWVGFLHKGRASGQLVELMPRSGCVQVDAGCAVVNRDLVSGMKHQDSVPLGM